jgi:hypothetical protein
MSSFNRKRAIFQRGAEALSVYSNISEDLYACPICLDVFRLDALSRGILTVEHVPPASLGRKGIALTCRDCNSRSGHTIDVALLHRERLFEFARAFGGKGSYTGRVRLDLGDQTLNADASISEGEVRLDLPSSINHPSKLASSFQHLDWLAQDDRWNGEHFKITPNIGFKRREAFVGDLKTAYLLAFAWLGYGYIFRRDLDPVRNTILNPRSEETKFYVAWLNPSPQERNVLLISSPFESIGVQLENRIVFLPPLDATRDFFSELAGKLEAIKSSGGLRGKARDWPSSLEMALDLQ